MKNKKYLYIFLIVVCLTVVIICIFIKNSGNTVIGTWKIDSFIYEDEMISFDKYGDYYGTDNQKAYNHMSIIFNKDNTSVIIFPTYDAEDTKQVECNYSVSKSVVTFTKDNDSIEAFQIKGETLQSLNTSFLREGYVFKKQ